MAVAGFPPTVSMETDAKPDALSTNTMSWQSPDTSVEGTSSLPQILEARCCELCGATQTPMWRRGPSGKGSVCNACGVRWASRRRGPRRNMEEYALMHSKDVSHVDSDATGGALEQYFCKYCGLTWPLNYFKNRQQFGAHCSNCSRKRKSRDVHPSMQGLVTEGETGHISPRSFGGETGRPLQIPRKVPRDDLQLPTLKSRAAHLSAYVDHDDTDDFLPPAKKFKTLQPVSPDSGDETYADSDSETVGSPYGPSANSLYRLLGAVENVLTEEREMSTMLSQMYAVRAMIDSLDETRKIALAGLEHTVMGQLTHIQHLISPQHISKVIEKEQAEHTKQETPSNASTTTPSTITPAPDSTESTESTFATPVPSLPKPPAISEAEVREEVAALRTSILAVEAAEADIETVMGPHPYKPVAPVPVTEVELPAALESATRDLVAVFANATLLQLGSNADIEAFKNCFVHVLNQSKVNINQDVATLFEALVNLKKRQTQLGQGTFIDHLQLRQINSDLHNLKQRVVHSSRAVQAMFVQLVTQFTEQIETAKRIYQENAGNHVRLLDEVVRSRLVPALTHDIDQLRSQLLAHINCVHANLAYLDNLVLTSE